MSVELDRVLRRLKELEKMYDDVEREQGGVTLAGEALREDIEWFEGFVEQLATPGAGLLAAFQAGFSEQLRARYQARFKPGLVGMESAEAAGFRAMLKYLAT